MIQVSDNAGRLDIVSPMHWSKRVLFALLALFPLLAPYQLLLRVHWTAYWHPLFLLAAVVSAGAVALSLLIIFAAVAGLSSRMTLDAARSRFTYSETAPVIPRRSRVFPLTSIASVHVHAQEWSDGPPSFALMLTMADGTLFRSGSFRSKAEAEQDQTQVQEFLDRARGFQDQRPSRIT